MKAIVILYDNSSSVAEGVVIEMLKLLNNALPTGSTPGTVTMLDDDAVAQALVTSRGTKTVFGTIIPEESPQDQAVIYLGEKYKNFISLSMKSFETALTKDFLLAKFVTERGRGNKDQKALINAMKTLSENSVYTLSPALTKKYNFNKQVLTTVIETYNAYNQ